MVSAVGSIRIVSTWNLFSLGVRSCHSTGYRQWSEPPVAPESSPFFSPILQRSSLAAVLGLGAEVSVLVGLALHGQLPVAFEANKLVDLRANKSQNFTRTFGRTGVICS